MPSSWPQLPTTPRKPAIQQYPTRTHLGKDVTPASGPIALDARLTDDDVIALLQTAYPETELEEIQGNDKIMEQYFMCVHHDRDVIRSHICLLGRVRWSLLLLLLLYSTAWPITLVLVPMITNTKSFTWERNR